MFLIARASSSAIVSTTILPLASFSGASGIESVTMSLESGLFSIRSMAWPESTGVRAGGEHLARPRRLDGLGHLGQRARGVDDVVDDERGAPLDVADHVVDLGHVRLVAPLVDDGERGVEPLGVGARALDAARVRRDDHEVRRGSASARAR